MNEYDDYFVYINRNPPYKYFSWDFFYSNGLTETQQIDVDLEECDKFKGNNRLIGFNDKYKRNAKSSNYRWYWIRKILCL